MGWMEEEGGREEDANQRLSFDILREKVFLFFVFFFSTLLLFSISLSFFLPSFLPFFTSSFLLLCEIIMPSSKRPGLSLDKFASRGQTKLQRFKRIQEAERKRRAILLSKYQRLLKKMEKEGKSSTSTTTTTTTFQEPKEELDPKDPTPIETITTTITSSQNEEETQSGKETKKYKQINNPRISLKKKSYDPLAKAKAIREAKLKDQEEQRKKALEEKQKRELRQKERKTTKKQMLKRTPKGQPIMANLLNNLLPKIEKISQPP
jgi:hypothetical protein